MVKRTCECCSYSTDQKSSFDKHMISERHIERCNNTRVYVECLHCKKKYLSKYGLQKHNLTCKPPSPPPSTQTVFTEEMIQAIMNTLSTMNEKMDTIAPQQIINNNNTNNQTNNQHIHLYLNTHCPNAINMTDFIDSIKFSTDDFKLFFKHIYADGAARILTKNFEKLTAEERPMHVLTPMLNKPSTFFIKNDNQWTEENQANFAYQMACINEWNSEEEKMLLTQFFQRFGDKLWDDWKTECKTNPKFNEIVDKMRRVSMSEERLFVLDDLVKVLASSALPALCTK